MREDLIGYAIGAFLGFLILLFIFVVFNARINLKGLDAHIVTNTEQDNNVICTIDTLEFISYHQEDRFNHFWGSDKDTVFVHGCVVVLEDGAILAK